MSRVGPSAAPMSRVGPSAAPMSRVGPSAAPMSRVGPSAAPMSRVGPIVLHQCQDLDQVKRMTFLIQRTNRFSLHSQIHSNFLLRLCIFKPSISDNKFTNSYFRCSTMRIGYRLETSKKNSKIPTFCIL